MGFYYINKNTIRTDLYNGVRDIVIANDDNYEIIS